MKPELMNVATIEKKIDVNRDCAKPYSKKKFRKIEVRKVNNIKVCLQYLRCEEVKYAGISYDRVAFVSTALNPIVQ
jgi:hypothetical protein